MKLLAGNSNFTLAKAVGDYLDMPLTRAQVRRFADQQIGVLESAQQELGAAGMPSGYGPNLAARFGVLSYRAAQDWAAWAAEQLAQRPGRAAASQ